MADLRAGVEDAIAMYKKISEDALISHGCLRNILDRIESSSNNLDVSHGNSLLQTRNDLLIAYLAKLVDFSNLKVYGKQVAGSDTIEKLIELRTYTEKIGVIYAKFKYQLDKIVSAAEAGIDQDDPMNLKPCPEDLLGMSQVIEDVKRIISDLSISNLYLQMMTKTYQAVGTKKMMRMEMTTMM